jgi:hypothetical protein
MDLGWGVQTMSDIDRLIKAMYSRPKYAIDWMNDFDPFTDANDDYEVLEWMRNRGVDCADYKIGDYAREALGMIDEN